MPEVNQVPEVGIYEKLRSFTVKHLSPLNTWILLGASILGGLKAVDHFGWITEAEPVVQQQPEAAKRQKSVAQPEATPSDPHTGTGFKTANGNASSTPIHLASPQQTAAQPVDDTIQMLSKQLDEERLKHANAKLDASLK